MRVSVCKIAVAALVAIMVIHAQAQAMAPGARSSLLNRNRRGPFNRPGLPRQGVPNRSGMALNRLSTVRQAEYIPSSAVTNLRQQIDATNIKVKALQEEKDDAFRQLNDVTCRLRDATSKTNALIHECFAIEERQKHFDTMLLEMFGVVLGSKDPTVEGAKLKYVDMKKPYRHFREMRLQYVLGQLMAVCICIPNHQEYVESDLIDEFEIALKDLNKRYVLDLKRDAGDCCCRVERSAGYVMFYNKCIRDEWRRLDQQEKMHKKKRLPRLEGDDLFPKVDKKEHASVLRAIDRKKNELLEQICVVQKLMDECLVVSNSYMIATTGLKSEEQNLKQLRIKCADLEKKECDEFRCRLAEEEKLRQKKESEEAEAKAVEEKMKGDLKREEENAVRQVQIKREEEAKRKVVEEEQAKREAEQKEKEEKARKRAAALEELSGWPMSGGFMNVSVYGTNVDETVRKVCEGAFITPNAGSSFWNRSPSSVIDLISLCSKACKVVFPAATYVDATNRVQYWEANSGLCFVEAGLSRGVPRLMGSIPNAFNLWKKYDESGRLVKWGDRTKFDEYIWMTNKHAVISTRLKEEWAKKHRLSLEEAERRAIELIEETWPETPVRPGLLNREMSGTGAMPGGGGLVNQGAQSDASSSVNRPNSLVGGLRARRAERRRLELEEKARREKQIREIAAREQSDRNNQAERDRVAREEREQKRAQLLELRKDAAAREAAAREAQGRQK